MCGTSDVPGDVLDSRPPARDADAGPSAKGPSDAAAAGAGAPFKAPSVTSPSAPPLGLATTGGGSAPSTVTTVTTAPFAFPLACASAYRMPLFMSLSSL